MIGWAIAGVAFYFLFVAPRKTQITSTAYTPPATGAPATGLSGGIETTISVPGIGTYTNVGGGKVVGISVDGSLVSALQNVLSGG